MRNIRCVLHAQMWLGDVWQSTCDCAYIHMHTPLTKTNYVIEWKKKGSKRKQTHTRTHKTNNACHFCKKYACGHCALHWEEENMKMKCVHVISFFLSLSAWFKSSKWIGLVQNTIPCVVSQARITTTLYKIHFWREKKPNHIFFVHNSIPRKTM